MSTVPVLLYHSVRGGPGAADNKWQVTADDFKANMELVLASGREALTAERYAQWLQDGCPSGREPILITFDDGFADFADVVVPILEDLDLQATVFLTSGWIGTQGMVSKQAVRDIDPARVEVGAHSVSHRHLDLLSERSATEEIRVSRVALEDLLGRQVTSFAYPHGSHHRLTKRIVQTAGFTTAHAVKNALSHAADDRFAIARFAVTSSMDSSRIAEVIDGRGLPLAWPGEKLRTRVYRRYRWLSNGCGYAAPYSSVSKGA
jgi:peptidoglycan/xylan/chitin deacetylase (PgdA/CDA1 family)